MEVLDDPRLDRIFRLVARASEPRPLPVLLRALCEDAAAILPADVVSVYLRETDDEGDVLVMRANVGFPEDAVGSVVLPLGEGVTGFAAEVQRPVMREQAETDSHWRGFDGLGEERFPAFLAWPLAPEGKTMGALVFQRAASNPFSDADLALAGALVSAFVLALDVAERRHVAASAERRFGAGEVRLGGTSLVGGAELGRAEVLATLRDLVGEASAEGLEDSIDQVIRKFDKGLAKLRLGDVSRAGVAQTRLVLEDARFKKELLKEVAQRGVAPGLAALARRYALQASRVEHGEDWLAGRAAEVTALCRLIAAQHAGRPLCRPGGVLLLPDRPGSLLAVEAAMRRVSAVVVADRLPSKALAAQILRDAEVPTVSEVAGLFDWVRPGDPLLVDGDAGLVWVNPSEERVGKLKARRKQ